MLSLERAREILGPDGEWLTDEELHRVLEELRDIALLLRRAKRERLRLRLVKEH